MQKALAGKVMVITDERDALALNGVNGNNGDEESSQYQVPGSKKVEIGQQVSWIILDSMHGVNQRYL